MSKRLGGGLAAVLAAFVLVGVARGGEPLEGDALVIRLLHPDQQAAEVLRLFEGARWSDPAAAMAAWKRRTSKTRLDRTIEAMIAFFNPEMAREWRVLDRAELRVCLDPDTGQPGWLAVIPRDDGTVADAITAMRLSYPEDRPLTVEGKNYPVARLDRSGSPLGCRFGGQVVVASSRTLLERAIGLIPRTDATGMGRLPDRRESGTLVRLEPERIPIDPNSTLWERRAIEWLRAVGCRRLESAASLEDGSLLLEVSTMFDDHPPRSKSPAIAPNWLTDLPSDGVLAAFCMAIPEDPGFWNAAFAAADRVERVDPARANLAPLRTRLNLLALGAGLKLEVDVLPHLRGVSACVFGDSALVALHMDERAIARRLVERVSTRMDTLIVGNGEDARPVIEARERSVWIAWGNRARSALRQGRPEPGHSLASLCGIDKKRESSLPARMGAFWPGRIARPAGLPEPVAAVLADDPPVIWRGRDEPGRSRDTFRWNRLRERVRDAMAAWPVDDPADGRLTNGK